MRFTRKMIFRVRKNKSDSENEQFLNPCQIIRTPEFCSMRFYAMCKRLEILLYLYSHKAGVISNNMFMSLLNKKIFSFFLVTFQLLMQPPDMLERFSFVNLPKELNVRFVVHFSTGLCYAYISSLCITIRRQIRFIACSQQFNFKIVNVANCYISQRIFSFMDWYDVIVMHEKVFFVYFCSLELLFYVFERRRLASSSSY